MAAENLKRFKDFLNEEDVPDSYDEQDEPTTAGIHSEDYKVKEQLKTIAMNSENLYMHLEDGEEVEDWIKEKVEAVSKTLNDIVKYFQNEENRERQRQEAEAQKEA